MVDDPIHEGAAALRAKATSFMNIAKLMGKDTRARMIQMASDYFERAVRLEEEQRRRDK
jgi:hypothetical protein